MKAVLEIEMPESCVKCKICNQSRQETNTGSFYKLYECNLVFADVGMFNDKRCPDCPLKFAELKEKNIAYAESGYYFGKSFFSDRRTIFCKEIVYVNYVPKEEILYELIDYNGYEAYVLIPGKILGNNAYGTHVPLGFWDTLELIKKEEI